jgi:hypothetical protein
MTMRQSGRSRSSRSRAFSAIGLPSGATAAMSNAAWVPASTASSANSGLMPIIGLAPRTGMLALAREPWPEGSLTSTSISAFSACVVSGERARTIGRTVLPSASVSGSSRSIASGAYTSPASPIW